MTTEADDAGHADRPCLQPILQAFRCVIGDQPTAYLSGPITTGMRWVESVSTGDPDPTATAAANAAAIRDAARLLRLDGTLVVEPASLNVPGWSQRDYIELWTSLIERHATEVRFVPGWEYSIGCAVEFHHALTHGITTCGTDGTEVTARDGLDALLRASEDLALRARQTSALEPLRSAIAGVAEQVARLVDPPPPDQAKG